jgi:hypothetical protein
MDGGPIAGIVVMDVVQCFQLMLGDQTFKFYSNLFKGVSVDFLVKKNFPYLICPPKPQCQGKCHSGFLALYYINPSKGYAKRRP